MQKINIANSWGVNILGTHIPKNAIYGYWHIKGQKCTYYITALEDFEKPCPNITAKVCFAQSQFRLSSIPKSSSLGKFLCNFALNHIPYGTRVEYAKRLHSDRYLVKINRDPQKCDDPFDTQGFANLRRPQTVFLGKVRSQEQVDGRSYANKLIKHKNAVTKEWDGTYEEASFYDKNAYNGWTSY